MWITLESLDFAGKIIAKNHRISFQNYPFLSTVILYSLYSFIFSFNSSISSSSDGSCFRSSSILSQAYITVV